MNELTMCSVYHSSGSKRLLELNREFTETLNTSRAWNWLVADNTPLGYTDHVDPKKFTVIKAMPFTELLKTGLSEELRAVWPSIHHGSAINLSLPHIHTRFALILDSDFYIVVPEWIEKVITHMKKNKIALMGVPWHPRWWKKIRNFPAHHALFIDGEQIPFTELDFLPQYTDSKRPPRRKTYNIPCMNMVSARRLVGGSRDTSYALYEKYGHGTVRVETLIPVFKFPLERRFFMRALKNCMRYVIPDRYSYTQREGTYSPVGFKERGYFDAGHEGWEEFIWNDQPFGFHMRRASVGKNRDQEEEFATLKRGLQSFV